MEETTEPQSTPDLREPAQLLDEAEMVIVSGLVYLAGSAEVSAFYPDAPIDEAVVGKVAKIRAGNGRIGTVEAFYAHQGTDHYHIGITGLESDA